MRAMQTTHPRHFAIVPAAGSGSRMAAARPKQYLSLLGRPLIHHALSVLCAVPAVDAVWRLIFSLRLAVLLHRTRDDRALPAWRVAATSGGFRIDMPAGWLAENPWTAAALGDEATVWSDIGRDYAVQSRAARRPA